MNDRAAPAKWTVIDLIVLAGCAGAAALSCYLLVQSLAADSQVPGCGEGSGCGEVLTSKYAKLLGLPVSAFAAAIYVALAGLWLARRRLGRRDAPAGLQVLPAAIGLSVIGSAGWFTYLQLFDLQAICPYCMADHAMGVAAAVAALVGLRAIGPGRWATAIVVAAIAVTALAVIQASDTQPLDYVGEGDGQATHTGRQLTLFDGQLQLDIAAEPHAGDVNAPHAIVLMYDFACPHCRHAHKTLDELVASGEREVVLVMLPIAIHPSCNPHMSNTPPRFDESCDLARAALAVWVADPGKFAEMERWMYEPLLPRKAADARQKAIELVGAGAFADAGDPADALLRRNIAAFGQSRAERVPVTIVVGHPPIEGRIDNADDIIELLDGESHK